MKLTKRGICYDLAETPFVFTRVYKGETLRFHFSSQKNLTKFVDRIDVNRDIINGSLTNRFKMTIKNDVLCDIKLYDSIENRGFFIVCNNGVIRWIEEITLIGQKIEINH